MTLVGMCVAAVTVTLVANGLCRRGSPAWSAWAGLAAMAWGLVVVGEALAGEWAVSAVTGLLAAAWAWLWWRHRGGRGQC